MPKNIHTATGPNGETFKRTSQGRTYPFTVVGRESYEDAVRRAHSRVEANAREFRQNQDWARDGFEPSAWMVGKPDFKDPTTTVAERFREDGKETGRKFLAEASVETAEEYAASELAKDLAAIEARKVKGDFDRFLVNFGWAGRLDLAQKLAGSSASSRYAEVRILETSIVTK